MFKFLKFINEKEREKQSPPPQAQQDELISDTDYCVCCGRVVPEGTLICSVCEKDF